MRTSLCNNYDTNVEIITSDSQGKLKALARLLGKQAAAHVHKYRFAGLGQIELIRLQQETKNRSNNKYTSQNKTNNTS